MSMQTTAFLYSDVGSNLGEQDQQAVMQLKSRHNRFVQYNLMACLLNKLSVTLKYKCIEATLILNLLIHDFMETWVGGMTYQ